MGRFSAASGCPISETTALTAAHVVDEEPFDPRVPLSPARWEDSLGNSGVIRKMKVSNEADLAVVWVDPAKTFKRWYPIAKKGPREGDALFVKGYDFRTQKNVYGDREWTKAKVLRTVAGHIVFKPKVDFGTSGSCILNGDGEVVGVVAWILAALDVTAGPAVWGDWLPPSLLKAPE